MADDNDKLTISPEKVCFIIIKAREFDAKEEVEEPNPASNPSDDNNIEILEDYPDDPVVEEITQLVNALSVDEQIDLVTLMWLGRDDYTAADWDSVREEAAAAHNERTAQYLLGLIYDKGQGVRQDEILAHMWLNLAAARARPREQPYYARIRDAVATKMSAGQLAEAQWLAVQWRPQR